LRGINTIPPIEMHPGAGCTELTVVTTDDSKYIISPNDLEPITYMTPGIYPVQDPAQGRRCYDLMIHETPLSEELYQAIKMTNEIVQKINVTIASPKGKGGVMSNLVRKGSTDQ